MINTIDLSQAEELYEELKVILLSKEDNPSFKYKHLQHHLHEESEYPGISKHFYNEKGSVLFKNADDQNIFIEIERWHGHKHNGYSGLNSVANLKAGIYMVKESEKYPLWTLELRVSFFSHEINVTTIELPKEFLKEKQLSAKNARK